jgi:hypothetical protein
MNCSDFEILLCDYIDGTLDAARKREFEIHLHECGACSELARDAMGAVAFMGRAAEATPPPELLTKIAFAIPSGGLRRKGGLKSALTGWLQPILQPRYVMGMAMTILSFSMLGRFAGIEVRQLKPSDLNPTRVWTAFDDRVHRAWERGVKYYENLKLVYEVQSRLKEWTDQEDEDGRIRAANANSSSAGNPGGTTSGTKGGTSSGTKKDAGDGKKLVQGNESK